LTEGEKTLYAFVLLMRLLPLVLLALLFGLHSRIDAATVYDEGVSGDLSNSGLSPTVLTLAIGSNQVFGTTAGVAGVDRDYLTFTVPSGLLLSSLFVLAGTTPSGVSFIGVQAGTQMTVPPNSSDATGLLGWRHYSQSDVGTDILDDMGIASFGSTGFVPPLGAGSYTFWIQEFNVSSYGFDFTLTQVPEPGTYAAVLIGLAIVSVISRKPRQ
jgi:hypothetical protein